MLSTDPARNRKKQLLKALAHLLLTCQGGEGKLLLADMPASGFCVLPAIVVEVSLTRFPRVSWMTKWLQLDPHASLVNATRHVDVFLVQALLLSCVLILSAESATMPDAMNDGSALTSCVQRQRHLHDPLRYAIRHEYFLDQAHQRYC